MPFEQAGIGLKDVDGRHLHFKAEGIGEVVIIPLGDELSGGGVDGQIAQLTQGAGSGGETDEAQVGVAEVGDPLLEGVLEAVINDHQLAVGVSLLLKAGHGALGQTGAVMGDHQAADERQGTGQVLQPEVTFERQGELGHRRTLEPLVGLDGVEVGGGPGRQPAAAPVVDGTGCLADLAAGFFGQLVPGQAVVDGVKAGGGFEGDLVGPGLGLDSAGQHIGASGFEGAGENGAGDQLLKQVFPEGVTGG